MINGFISKHKELKDYSSLLLDFVCYFKTLNGYENYTVNGFNEAVGKFMKNIYSDGNKKQIINLIPNKRLLADLVNNTQLYIDLDIYTPDHKYCPKHTFVMKYKETEDTTTTMHVRVYSSVGLVKEYDMPAIGMTMQDLSNLIDKERNNYKSNK